MEDVVAVFRTHEQEIVTEDSETGLKSDDVLAVVGPDLASVGVEVEASRQTNWNAPYFSGRTAFPRCATR